MRFSLKSLLALALLISVGVILFVKPTGIGGGVCLCFIWMMAVGALIASVTNTSRPMFWRGAALGAMGYALLVYGPGSDWNIGRRLRTTWAYSWGEYYLNPVPAPADDSLSIDGNLVFQISGSRVYYGNLSNLVLISENPTPPQYSASQIAGHMVVAAL